MIEVTKGVFAPNRLRAVTTLVVATILASWASIAAPAEGVGPLAIAKQGYFFVGGQYMDQPGGQVMAGHAYVDYQIPQELKHPTRS
jgi:hypothetical protein